MLDFGHNPNRPPHSEGTGVAAVTLCLIIILWLIFGEPS